MITHYKTVKPLKSTEPQVDESGLVDKPVDFWAEHMPAIGSIMALPGDGRKGILYCKYSENRHFITESLRRFFHMVAMDINYNAFTRNIHCNFDLVITASDSLARYNMDKNYLSINANCNTVIYDAKQVGVEYLVSPHYGKYDIPWEDRSIDVLISARNSPDKNWELLPKIADELKGLSVAIHTWHNPSKTNRVEHAIHHINQSLPIMESNRKTIVNYLNDDEMAVMMSNSKVFLNLSMEESGPRILFNAYASGCAPIVPFHSKMLLLESIGMDGIERFDPDNKGQLRSLIDHASRPRKGKIDHGVENGLRNLKNTIHDGLGVDDINWLPDSALLANKITECNQGLIVDGLESAGLDSGEVSFLRDIINIPGFQFAK